MFKQSLYRVVDAVCLERVQTSYCQDVTVRLRSTFRRRDVRVGSRGDTDTVSVFQR
jgi:hypothetical protein